MGSHETVSDMLTKLSQWSPQEVQDNLNEVLPVLISSLGREDQKALSLQAVQALLASCLPCLPIKTVEKQLLQHVLPAAEGLFMEALEGINVTLQDAENMSEQDVEFAVTSLLQVCLELLNHLDLTLLYIESHGQVKATYVPSIPKVILSTLLESFRHCKQSDKLSGSMFHIVNDAVSNLFYKSNELQTHFYGILKDNLKFNCTYEDEVCHLIEVLQMVGCIGEQVTGLGLQVLAYTWKEYITLVEHFADRLKTQLDVAAPLRFLANAVMNHLNTIVGGDHVDTQLAIRMLKIAAFELKMIMRLCRHYAGYLGDCFSELLQLLITLHRYSLPCLQFQQHSEMIAENIEKHVTIGAEPLLIQLISERAFVQVYFNVASKIPENDSHSLGFLLLTVTIVKKLLHCDSNVRKLWMDADMNSNLLCVIFKTLDYCHAGLCCELGFPGIMYGGELPRTIDLYEFILYHVSGFIVLTPASEFNLVERILLENVLQPDIWKALLAMDIWCIVARYGSAELCFQHVCFLVDMLKTFSPTYCCVQRTYLKALISRLFPLLLNKHQIQMLELVPLVQYADTWQGLGLKSLPEKLLLGIAEELINSTVLSINKFLRGTSSLQTYDAMLSCMLNTANVLEVNRDVALAELTASVMSLWECVPACVETDEASVEGSQWLNNFVSVLCGITTVLVAAMNNAQLLKVLCKLKAIASCCPSSLKICTINILKSLAIKIIENNPDCVYVINSIANLFTILLQDMNPVVCQMAYEVFAYFAHVTKHEQIVRVSVSSNKHLQKQITLYLTNIPVDSISDKEGPFRVLDYLRCQTQVKFVHKCKKRIRNDVEKLKTCLPYLDVTLDPSAKRSEMNMNITKAIAQLQKDTEPIVRFCAQNHLTMQEKQDLMYVIKQLESVT